MTSLGLYTKKFSLIPILKRDGDVSDDEKDIIDSILKRIKIQLDDSNPFVFKLYSRQKTETFNWLAKNGFELLSERLFYDTGIWLQKKIWFELNNHEAIEKSIIIQNYRKPFYFSTRCYDQELLNFKL